MITEGDQRRGTGKQDQDHRSMQAKETKLIQLTLFRSVISDGVEYYWHCKNNFIFSKNLTTVCCTSSDLVTMCIISLDAPGH